MDKILKHSDTRYEVYCMVQDDTISVGTFSSETEARKRWVNAQYSYNRNKVNEEDVPLFVQRQRIVTEWVLANSSERNKNDKIIQAIW